MGFLAEDPPEKANYRSCGRSSAGVQMTPHFFSWRDKDAPAGPSTIPARYDTVLYKHNREERAFGSMRPRFQPARADHAETTEPLAVHGAPKSNAARGAGAATAACVGKKGSNAFASKSHRLPASSAHTRRGPGPGAYEAATPPRTPRGVGKPSAGFVEPANANPLYKLNARPSPGPGHYDTHAAVVSARGVPASFAAHISQAGVATGRVVGPAHLEANPGPGAYELRAGPAVAASGGARASSTPPPSTPSVGPKLTAGGEPASARRRLVPEAGLTSGALAPANGSRLRAATESAERHVREKSQLRRGMEILQGGEECIQRSSSLRPGPGDYDVQPPRPSSAAPKGSSSFQSGRSSMARRYRAPPPGPGNYDPKVGNDAGARPAAASAFASLTERGHVRKSEAPGPAFYSPKAQPNAASFHLNLTEKWMA